MLNFLSKQKDAGQGDADFIRQYLEQDRQNSNVYFHLAQRERLQRKQKGLLREKMMRRFFLLFSSAIAVIIIVSAVSIYQPGTGSTVRSFSEASFKDVLSGSAALADFRFQKAAAAFKQVEQEGVVENKVIGLSALTLAASRYFAPSEETAPDITQTFMNAAKTLAHAYQKLATLSPDAFFGSGGVQRAGVTLALAKKEIQDAQELLAGVTKPGLWKKMTDEEQLQVSAAFADIPAIQASQDKMAPTISFLARLFDPQQSKKILVLLQNQNIPRATGGFIDAVGVISIAGGAITGISFDDVNNLDGQLTAKIIPPVQLQNSTTSWGMRDMNWFLDFPTSAGKAASFYRKSGGGAVDGVVVLDEELLADLLYMTGPVSASSGEINTDNILTILRAHVQKQKEKIIPVSVLNETIPLLFKKLALLSEEDISSALHMFTDALSRKNAMVWFRDEELQKIATEERWDGSISHGVNINYLAFSAYDMDEDILPNPLSQDILVQTDIAENGGIINTVAVQMQRHGDDSSQAGDDSQYYVKLYVPKGSQLIAVSGGSEQPVVPQIDYKNERFIPDEDVYASEATLYTDHANKVDVFEETGKTVFGTYVMPGFKGAKLLYHYKLPFSLADAKNDFVSVFQKQPGSRGTLQFSMILPDKEELIVSDEHPFDGEFSGAFVRDLTFSAQVK